MREGWTSKQNFSDRGRLWFMPLEEDKPLSLRFKIFITKFRWVNDLKLTNIEAKLELTKHFYRVIHKLQSAKVFRRFCELSRTSLWFIPSGRTTHLISRYFTYYKYFTTYWTESFDLNILIHKFKNKRQTSKSLLVKAFLKMNFLWYICVCSFRENDTLLILKYFRYLCNINL